MQSSPFRIVEHVTPCQHIREYPRATADEQETTLLLSVKQYIPLDNPNPRPGDVTILGAHANGFPKELYEPLWEELIAQSKKYDFNIRAIWIADVAHQGHSGVLNEHALGNDPSWMDHPRDLLHFINLKRAEMPQPIIGIGHSMGGNNLINLSLMHPRLITSLILLDPVVHRLRISNQGHTFHTKTNRIPTTTAASTYRRDIWPSRKSVEEALKKNKFYQSWDPRVLDRWIRYGLRDLPTAIHPINDSHAASRSENKDSGDGPVTLTTTRHQEVFTFSRPGYRPDGAGEIDRLTHPDFEQDVTGGYPFYRAEPPITFSMLPHLRPSVFYFFADKSDMCLPELCQDKLDATGVGLGGSGGVAAGKVKSIRMENVGHLIAMEAVNETADRAAEWIELEIRRWKSEDKAFREEWDKKSNTEKVMIDDEWKKHIGPPRDNGRRLKPKI